ncbi:hypothetical protein FQR65_LT06094 [Abscondita terminalis]|nr:hypothetical protein FQR65_LT06094 [Abscondita terminalis]
MVKVSIYYEALCYDSKRFIINQLYPAYSQIGYRLLLDFVPYGKASHTLINDKWIFRCQHGELECLANKYQACGLEFGKSQYQTLEYIYCLSTSANASSVDAVGHCAPKLGKTAEDILRCSESRQGDELLVKYGDRTHSIQPIVTFVPTIIYNDDFDPYLQELSLKNFLKAVCAILDNKPKECHSFIGSRDEDYFYLN